MSLGLCGLDLDYKESNMAPHVRDLGNLGENVDTDPLEPKESGIIIFAGAVNKAETSNHVKVDLGSCKA